jgi:hypothetical protein
MTSRQPGGVRGPDDDGGTTLSAAVLWPRRGLIAVMLVAAAALDLARCGIVLATARHAGPAIALVAAGLAAAALSLRTARGCRSGRRWSAWAALLIGAASAPQAAGSGFHPPYTIPDIATAVLGVLLAVAVLATAGPARQPEQLAENPCLDLGSTRWPAVRRPASAPVNSDYLLSVLVDESTEAARRGPRSGVAALVGRSALAGRSTPEG